MKNSSVFLFALFLTACSQFVPFEDMRREAGQIPTVGKSSNASPVICYNPIWHDVQDTQELADKACARTNKKATYVESKHFNCRFVNPYIAIYECK